MEMNMQVLILINRLFGCPIFFCLCLVAANANTNAEYKYKYRTQNTNTNKKFAEAMECNLDHTNGANTNIDTSHV